MNAATYIKADAKAQYDLQCLKLILNWREEAENILHIMIWKNAFFSPIEMYSGKQLFISVVLILVSFNGS